jgi:hypothetical protein
LSPFPKRACGTSEAGSRGKQVASSSNRLPPSANRECTRVYWEPRVPISIRLGLGTLS